MSKNILNIQKDIDYLASIDARGFIFGSALSDRLSLPNILIRKKVNSHHLLLAKLTI